MASLSLSEFRTQHRTFLWVFAGLLVIDIAILTIAGDNLVILLTDLFFPFMGLFASGVLFYVSFKLRPFSSRFALPWAFMALSCLAWTFGDITWAILEVFLQQDPFPSLADVFYLLYYPLLVAGLLLIPHDGPGRKGLLTNSLDLGIIFLAAGLLYWNFLIGPVAAYEEADAFTFLISVAYPIFDLVLFAALMLLVFRKKSAISQKAFLFLILSVTVQILSDSIYGLQSITETYTSGTFLDLSWQVGFATFGLAGVFQLHSLTSSGTVSTLKAEPEGHQKIYSWLPFLPYIWLAAAYALMIYSQQNPLPMSYQAIAVIIGVMLALVLARQVISIVEITHISERLKLELTERQRAQEKLNQYNNELEQRVQKRTAELTEANIQLSGYNTLLLGYIEERRRSEELLEASLHEKEVLLKEIHHRVKNNLQVISSMLKLQASQVKDPAVVVALMDSQNRVQSMALIHEKLYQSVNLADINFAEYMESLVVFLNRSYTSSLKQVNLKVQAEPISLYIDLAVPCGLIVNELVSNALKHAFPNGKGGNVDVQLKALPDSRVELVVRDNGVGIPEGVDIWDSPSLGLQLVNALVSQLDGDLQFETGQGTRFAVSFRNVQPT
jgi:two-component sensor histidine kinase